jgi:hypothetical protein
VVIRNAKIHMVGDQPMICDLEAMPSPSDAVLVCTNLRLVDGRKPLSTDHIDSWFMIPLQFIRFVEIPRASLPGPVDPAATAGSAADGRGPVASLLPGPATPVGPAAPEQPLEVSGSAPGEEATGPGGTESDEDLWRRIREI